MIEDPANQTTLGHDVFVSYASQDAAVANSIVENLEQHGLKCWIAPRDVKPGAQYADAIVRAINEAKAVVLVMSGSAVGSSHVGREIERAASKHRKIIAFRVDAAPLNHALEYFLSESQWIDVPALGMQAALVKLKEAVGQGTASSPQGIAAVRPPGRANKRIAIAAAVVVALGVAVGLGVYFWKSNHGGAHPPAMAAITDKSIAVLPFTDMSEKKDQEYFADGMAEEIIDVLVKIPGLKVISRTSSFQFKGKTEDLRSIATQLGVAYVLEGSVRKSGDHLRVTAQLINSRDGTHLFSQTYDRDLSDVLKMQDEIALALVRALQIEVDPESIESRPVLRSTEAYTLYLQGVHAFDRFDQQGLEQALSDFQRAFELDPSFAAAANACGAVYAILGSWGLMPPTVAFEKSRKFTDAALKLDPKLAIAHASLGDLYRANWDWVAADREMQIAVALAPRNALVLSAAAGEAQSMGRWDDSLRLANASLAVDPLNPGSYAVLAFTQEILGRPKEAEAAMRRALTISPTYFDGHMYLGALLLAGGEPETALPEMLKETDDGARLVGAAAVYFALGRKADSDAALAKLLKSQAEHHPFIVAEAYASRGESDEALKWLDRAYLQRDGGLALIESDLALRKLLNDPRYKAFLRKMNLPE
jgi:TolB-like protein/Flp pilus assembly protein TadD